MTAIEEQLKQFENMKDGNYIKQYFLMGVQMEREEAQKELLDKIDKCKCNCELCAFGEKLDKRHMKMIYVEDLFKQSLNSPQVSKVERSSTPLGKGDSRKGKDQDGWGVL